MKLKKTKIKTKVYKDKKFVFPRFHNFKRNRFQEVYFQKN